MGRVLALDLGDKRIGIALSDPTGLIAGGLESYTRISEEKDIAYLCALAQEKEAEAILFGMPRNMNGSYGPQSEKVKAFAEKLGALFSGEICFYDERMTTIMAERVLIDADMSRKKRRQVVDKVAAVMILQSYLDSQNMKRS